MYAQMVFRPQKQAWFLKYNCISLLSMPQDMYVTCAKRQSKLPGPVCAPRCVCEGTSSPWVDYEGAETAAAAVGRCGLRQLCGCQLEQQVDNLPPAPRSAGGVSPGLQWTLVSACDTHITRQVTLPPAKTIVRQRKLYGLVPYYSFGLSTRLTPTCYTVLTTISRIDQRSLALWPRKPWSNAAELELNTRIRQRCSLSWAVDLTS